MADIEKGDRVIATDAVPTDFLATVDKGTKGVIVDVDVPFIGSTTYAIHWENGEASDGVEERHIAKLAADSSADGCALLFLVGRSSVAVAHRIAAKRYA